VHALMPGRVRISGRTRVVQKTRGHGSLLLLLVRVLLVVPRLRLLLVVSWPWLSMCSNSSTVGRSGAAILTHHTPGLGVHLRHPTTASPPTTFLLLLLVVVLIMVVRVGDERWVVLWLFLVRRIPSTSTMMTVITSAPHVTVLGRVFQQVITDNVPPHAAAAACEDVEKEGRWVHVKRSPCRWVQGLGAPLLPPILVLVPRA